MSDDAPVLGVGMVGYAFMGAAHSQAWRTAGRFFDLPYAPSMVALSGRNAEAAGQAARRLGWAWRDSDVDIEAAGTKAFGQRLIGPGV